MSVRPHRLIYRDTAAGYRWTRRAYARVAQRDEAACQLRALGMEVEAWDVIELPLPEPPLARANRNLCRMASALDASADSGSRRVSAPGAA